MAAGARSRWDRVVKERPQCVLVDDDQDFLTFARYAFAHLHPEFEVIAFREPSQALDFLTRHPADLVISDFRMPQMDGLVLTRTLRAFDRRLPIVIMSSDHIESAAAVAGADAFVPKQSFLARLASVLGTLGFTHPEPERAAPLQPAGRSDG